MARPRDWPEAVAAVPAAGLVVAVGAVSPAGAWSTVSSLLPVVGFLAAVLVLAQLCDDDGLFVAAGDAVARTCRGRPTRLLGGVFVVASLTTAVLSLDATVVLLTPVVFATAARVGARPRSSVYACTHLANSASLLLPVSNLTNLLAFTAGGLSFTRFAAVMTPPGLVSIGVEYVVLRRFFAADLAVELAVPAPPGDTPPDAGGDRGAAGAPLPRFTVTLLGLTLAGFVAASLLDVSPIWAAVAGTAVLAGRALHRRRTTAATLLASASPAFLLFVLALGVVVRGVVDNGLADALSHLLPRGDGLPALLAVAALAAALANLINNLPAVLALLPIVTAAPAGAGRVLAVLIGVNLGPNLTYVGSLATLMWRQVRDRDADPSLGEYTRLGLVSVPLTLVAATVALWTTLRAVGG